MQQVPLQCVGYANASAWHSDKRISPADQVPAGRAVAAKRQISPSTKGNIMKLKLNKDGSAVVKDGKPVYVYANGREEAFDAPAAWKLALGKHFETSPTMAGLKIPHDLAAAAFSDAFRIEGGKLVAVDQHGMPLYSPTRHGEVANFDEALASWWMATQTRP